MNKPFGTLLYFIAACCACSGMLPASERAGSDAQPEIRTLTIQEAVRMILARSPDVLLTEAQAIRAGEALRESRSLNLPQATIGTGLAYNNGFPLSIEGAAPSIIEIGASQSILSKKNANLIREAEQSRKAGQLSIESAREELASKAASAYYELYRSSKTIALASAGLGAAEKQQELVETLLEAGRARPVDVNQARTATSAARQQLLVAEEQAKLAEKELREWTGLPEAVSIRTLEPRIDSPLFELQEETLYRQAAECAPDILQAETNVKAKEFHVEAEKGERLPRMEIISQYALFSRANNYDEFFNRFTRHNFLLGLSIQVPVFTGSRTSARVAQSRQEVSEARYRLQGMKSDLKLNIERGLSNLRIARGECDRVRSDVQSAREMVAVSETLLESGRISAKELEDSRSQLRQKELALLEADQLLFQRKLELLRTAGSVASAIQ